MRDVAGPYGFGGPVGEAAFYDAYEAWCREQGRRHDVHLVPPALREPPLRAVPRRAARRHGCVAARRGRPLRAAAPPPPPRGAQGRGLRDRGAHHGRAGRPRAVRAPLRADDGARRAPRASTTSRPSTGPRSPSASATRSSSSRRRRTASSRPRCSASRAHPGSTTTSAPPSGRGGANNLLFLEAARWAREQGFTRFHLGGGVGGADDSLLEFKLRFDEGGLIESAVGKAIHDEAAYRELGGAGFDGFFPAYRAAR